VANGVKFNQVLLNNMANAVTQNIFSGISIPE
jgi:hypothetical protein